MAIPDELNFEESSVTFSENTHSEMGVPLYSDTRVPSRVLIPTRWSGRAVNNAFYNDRVFKPVYFF